MGNGFGKLGQCLTGGGWAAEARRRQVCADVTSEPYDEGLGHSFCYVPKVQDCAAAAVADVAGTTTFRAISGAAVSANASTPLSTSLLCNELTWPLAAAAFESSDSFSAVPLQPVPRFPSGPLADRGFLSGPIERGGGFMSGPLDQHAAAGLFSGPLDKPVSRLARSLSHGLGLRGRKSRAAASVLRGFRRALSHTIKGPALRKDSDPESSTGSSSSNPSAEAVADDVNSSAAGGGGGGVQWAQGKAGEDRVHVVVSEERGWVFVGIYDGFNGPDATDYLLSNLYSAVQRELKGLLWEDKFDSRHEPFEALAAPTRMAHNGCRGGERMDFDKKKKFKGVVSKLEEKQRSWKCEWNCEQLELERRLKEQLNRTSSCSTVNHEEVLEALSTALRKTEEAYLGIADKMVSENPELALMGSCVLVMLMKGEDMYIMNVGDSRAVLAHKAKSGEWSSIDPINEEMPNELETSNGWDHIDGLPNLAALQLTCDHSTCVEEEVHRIRNEHPDDDSAIVNDRVKGSLKVTRAFGAGFLKQPKWNNALLEMFRIDYVGTSPYITCSPSLYHHKLGSRDRFLILSSDGLYQYFTNDEAVAQVELFIATSPDGDPAQHLVEEVLFRAAEKAGMEFHELLEIPQGDRRRYHDDVSVIVISLEGRIWRSSV